MINMTDNDAYDETIACPKCEIEMQRWMPHLKYIEKFCSRCGEKLVPRPPQPAPEIIPIQKLPISELTALILKTIKDIRESEKEETTKLNELRKELYFKEPNSYHSNSVSVDDIVIEKAIGEGPTAMVMVYKKSMRGGILISDYRVELEALPMLWDDLTDILALPCHPKTKLRYFRQFTVKGKPYEHLVTKVICEGGEDVQHTTE